MSQGREESEKEGAGRLWRAASPVQVKSLSPGDCTQPSIKGASAWKVKGKRDRGVSAATILIEIPEAGPWFS